MRPILPAILLLSVLSFVPAPSFAATPVEQARALLDASDPRAAAAVAALVKADPTDVDARVLLVRVLLSQRKVEAAVDLAEDVVDDAPDDAQAQFWLGNAYGNRIGEVGMLGQARIAPKIRTAYEQALALDPDLHQARQYLVQFHLQAPSIVGGDVEKAREQQRELARRDPPLGHYTRGMIARHDEQPEVAIEAYLAAWHARPEDKGFRMAAGFALQEAKRWDEAFALFEAWISEDPANATGYYQLGRCAALSGKNLERGATALKHYLSLPQVPGQPEPQHAWYRLGQVQVHAGDVDAARASLQKALQIDADLEEAQAELDRL
jgi:tetratricopeptide (TPR) repeat protein